MWATKAYILRIYTDIVLAIKENGLSVDNPLTRYPSKKRGVKEMENIYKNLSRDILREFDWSFPRIPGYILLW